MKGVIFNVLEEMVESQFGMEKWNEILEATPCSDGIYIAGENYPDEDAFALIATASEILQIPAPDLIGAFGEYLFHQLSHRHPVFVESQPTLRAFLKSVHSVIHVEVNKLYTTTNLPMFEYFEPDDQRLIMRYHSPRKLCILAEGLIRGAAAHYQHSIELKHEVCIHKGSDFCDLEVTFHER